MTSPVALASRRHPCPNEEIGQSYADIELLSRIAAYFDVTVDALMEKGLVESVAANPVFEPLSDGLASSTLSRA